jgi:hypothetical protein
MQYAARIAVVAWFVAGIAPALAAAPPDEIGLLTCTVGPIVNATASDNSVGNEAREMFCSFKTGMAPEETYAALLRSIGGKTAEGLVSRVSPVQTAVRNCTGDEGRPFGFGDQVADPKPLQAAVVKSDGGERCGKVGTMIPAGKVERDERKRTVAEVSKAV